MVLKRLVILLLLAAPLGCLAQSVDDAIEQWLEEAGSEETASDLHDMLEQWRSDPFNVNDTAALQEMPLFNHLQRLALRNYIALHGELLSLAELQLMPGFDSLAVAMLAPYITAAPVRKPLAFKPWQGRHTLVTGLTGMVEQAQGYSNGHYTGDNMRALACYTYNYQNRLSIRLVADKDATEEWGKGNYYGYHLMLSNIGRMERLVVGRYNLQFGQGLTMWTGLKPFSFTGRSVMQSAGGVRQASAFYEENYQEGIAATVRIGRGLHLSAFGSHTDAESLGGGHLEWRHGNLIAGVTAAYTLLPDSIQLRNYAYNANQFDGDRLFNGGMDLIWQWRRFTIYGEASFDADLHLAALVGVTATAANSSSIGVTFRHYDQQYHNLHTQGYSMGNSQGERGVTLDASVPLPLHLQALASLDLHHFDNLRYGSYMPSTGAWLRTQLVRRWCSSTESNLRYTCRLKERNIPYSDSLAYLGEATAKHQLQADVRTTTGPWRLAAKAVYSLFDSENGDPQRGWLVAATARYTHHRLQATAELAWFDISDYDARIYLSESSMQYMWSSTMLNGNGLRGLVLLRYTFGEHLVMAARYALTYLPGEESIGSGDSSTEGPTRQTWQLQMRLKF